MRRWTKWAPLLGALAAAVLVQAGALRAPFFADDWLFLDQVRPRGFVAALVSPDPIGNFVRPLGRAAWFWLLGRASGESAFGFHAASLVLWAVSVGLLWAIARRIGGDRVAAVAAALFAITQAADVPVWWACGSQDLLALALALGSILAMLSGRRWAAAVLLFLAPFAKESVAVAFVPAALLVRVPREAWSRTLRRAAPLAGALVAWAILASLVFVRRHTPVPAIAISPWGLPAALWDAVRTALGLEWRTSSPPWVPFTLPGPWEGAALVLAALAAGWVRGPTGASARRAEAGRDRRTAAHRRRAGTAGSGPAAPSPPAPPASAGGGAPHPLFVGLAWVLPAVLPTAFVAPMWSSYYLLFACAGLAVGIALLLARVPRIHVVTAVVVLGMAMQQARTLDEFAMTPSPWSAQSHVNRFYLQRGMSVMSECVASLRRLHPTLPRGTTLYVSGIPSFAAFQVADGPLVRGVYRDTSLRSCFLSSMTSDGLHRGPFFMLEWNLARREFTDRTLEPDVWVNLGLGNMLGGNPALAAMAFRMEVDRKPGSRLGAYALALAWAAMGDSIAARRQFLALGFALGRSAGPRMAEARARIARGDTAGAIAAARTATLVAVYDPEPHRFLAERGMPASGKPGSSDIIEAYAAVTLAPGYPPGWRMWGVIQANWGHETAGLHSLEQYFTLDPPALARDSQARAWRDALRERQPGGHVAQSLLKDDFR